MPNVMGRKRNTKPNAWAKRIMALQSRLQLDDQALADKLSTILPGFSCTARAVQGWRLNEREPSGAWPALIAQLESGKR